MCGFCPSWTDLLTVSVFTILNRYESYGVFPSWAGPPTVSVFTIFDSYENPEPVPPGLTLSPVRVYQIK